MAQHIQIGERVTTDRPANVRARWRGRTLAIVIATLLVVGVAAIFLMDVWGFTNVPTVEAPTTPSPPTASPSQ